MRGAGLPLCDAGCLGHRTLFVPVALRAYFLSPVEPRKEIHQTEVLLFRPDCLTLKTFAHMASPSITAAAGTSMPARRRCAAQKYFSITHLLRGPARERIGSY